MMNEYKRYDAGELLRDRYLKVNDISEGSYGLVSVAKDTKKDNKLVAVKFIYPLNYHKNKAKPTRTSSSPVKLKSSSQLSNGSNRPSEESIWKSLYNEAQKEIKIHEILGNHPNISSLYDHFDSCLVLEYCSRGDLYDAIHNGKGPSTSQDIKDVFLQILSALEFCHSNQVYHRDLKPENILIAEDWSIKLCDWGLATTTKIITNKSEFDIGSERYMAPELFDNDIDSYDSSKIDIWSIGIILLTLVFHKNPFQVANYSDKRFLQFVGNREALFDIFSTMSGDMFSVLRFCLNIDPTNRDLSRLKSELQTLKYFTIDEEYWGSDYEEEDEDELEFEDDDYYYKKDPVASVSPAKPAPLITTSNFDEPVASIPVKSLSKTTNSSESESSKSISNAKVDDRGDPMPHNHRADALLSSNTNLKPIPISNNGIRNIRNTRKPFNVASFNQSSQGRFGASNGKHFNREDFFTPKSVFNHYMDKYGEQRFGSNNYNKYGKNGESRNKPNKPRYWKKNYKKGKPREKHSNGNTHRHHASNDYSHNYSSSHGFDINHNGRRKSRSFSTGKSRKSTGVPIGSANSVSNTFHNLPPPNTSCFSTSANSHLSASGKYIPPYLRSPTSTRSPVIAPLTEEIDNLSLSNDYDEVFHLEDDFEDLGSTPVTKPELGLSSAIQFKKPNFRGANATPDSLGDYKNSSQGYNINGSSNDRRSSTATPSTRRPISVGTMNYHGGSVNDLALSSSVGRKYVPPFRRTSQPKCKPDKKVTDDKLGMNIFKPSSVPVNGSDFAFKKDWSDYE